MGLRRVTLSLCMCTIVPSCGGGTSADEGGQWPTESESNASTAGTSDASSESGASASTETGSDGVGSGDGDGDTGAGDGDADSSGDGDGTGDGDGDSSGDGDGTGDGDGDGDGEDRVFAYLLQFSSGGASNIANLDFEGIDVVNHAFIEPFADGSIAPLSPFDDYRTAGLPEAAHAAGSKILFSVGGANHSVRFKDSIGPNPAIRQAFADNVVDAINTWGYDGVDIDYEFPTDANEEANHREIMKLVYEGVKANDPDHLVTFGVSPGYWLPDFDWAQLGQWTDYAIYFCYDWNLPANGPMTNPGVMFTMHGGEQIESSCAGAMRYMVDGGFPPEKIIVGMPFYSGGVPWSAVRDTWAAGVPWTPHADYMETNIQGAWWTTPEALELKLPAVLDAGQTVLDSNDGPFVASGVAFWEWGYEDPAQPDLSRALVEAMP
jgi:hypothetical protein